MDGAVIGARLRELREASGLTQQQVAEQLGLKHKSAIKNYEKGQLPGAELLVRYSEIFEVSIQWIIYGSQVDGGKVRERAAQFGGLNKDDQKALKEFYEFLQAADAGRKRHIRRQIRYLLDRFKDK